MTKFLLPIAINVINKAVDKLPEDLDDLLKKFPEVTLSNHIKVPSL